VNLHALDLGMTRTLRALRALGTHVMCCSALAVATILAAPAAHAQAGDGQGMIAPDARLELAYEAQRLFDEAAALETRDAAAALARFGEAASIYRRISDSGVRNGELMLNLGNSLVKSGETSRALAAYLEAERLLPGDARVQDALAYARAAAGSRLGPVTGAGPLDQVASLWSAAPLPARAWTALAAWLGAWALVAAGILTGWRRPMPWRSAIAAVAVICVVPAATVGVDVLRTSLDRPGVVIADAVVLRKGNGEGFAPAVEESLPSGAEFMMLEERPGWLRVRLPDGQSGWIRQGDALVCGTSAPASP